MADEEGFDIGRDLPVFFASVLDKTECIWQNDEGEGAAEAHAEVIDQSIRMLRSIRDCRDIGRSDKEEPKMMCITGSVGIQGSARERTQYSDSWANAYAGFSITSAAFGGIIIIAYSNAIASYNSWYFSDRSSSEMALSAIILILGITEFVIGIWATVMSCLIGTCCCCDCWSAQSNQPTSVVYMSGQGAVMGSYVMGQGAGGDPVAFPMQQAGGVVTVPGGHPQIVHMPAVGMVQPQTYHLSATGAGGGQSQTVMVPQTGMQSQMFHGAEGSQLPMFDNKEAGQPQFVTVSPAMQGMEAPENQALVPPPYNGDQQFPVKT